MRKMRSPEQCQILFPPRNFFELIRVQSFETSKFQPAASNFSRAAHSGPEIAL
jgi:hypothetical protein